MKFQVKDKRVILIDRTMRLVGDNEYEFLFEFDEEWEGKTKTARFIMGDYMKDIVLNNDKCLIEKTFFKGGQLKVGVYASNVATTVLKQTFKPSILEESGGEPTVPENLWTQLLEIVETDVQYVRQAVSDAEQHAQNAQEAVSGFGDVVRTKTAEFNTNAATKQTEFNQNAADKIREYDEHITDYTTEINSLKSDLTDVIEKVQCKNLLDVSNCELNKYLDVNGVLSDYNKRNVTDFIPVEKGMKLVGTYTFSGTQTLMDFSTIVLYDINKNLVSGGVINTNKYTIPNGVSYVRCTIHSNLIDYSGQIELTEDGTPTPYEPYIEPYKKLTDKVIEKSNIATKEYVDSKKVSFSDMTENIGCSLPISEYFMTVGIAESWYSDSFVTPKGFLVNLFSGSKATRYNDRIYFVNNEEYHENNAYAWHLYDSLLNEIKSVNNTGYGFARNCRTLNLQNCSLLAIGDSTVDHDVMTAKIKSFFTENGKEITLLGTLGDGKGNGNNNEGRAGWKSSDYFTNKQYNSVVNPFYNPTSGTFDFSYYMNQQGYSSVDFVVIQLGINDLYNYDDTMIVQTWENVKMMIDSVHAFNADIKVILNLPTTPNADQSKHSVFEPLYRNRIIRYCEYATVKANELYSTSKVRISYCHLILNPNTDIRDNVHPTNDGYEKMALEVVNQINNWQN